jgi:hypothetical protein
LHTLAPVTPVIRERIAGEFDERGPEACVAEVIEELRRNNPELLDMATKCAASQGNYAKVMQGFGMFYRLMLAAAMPERRASLLNPLPRVAPEIRDLIVRQIDRGGAESFTMEVIDDLERSNPELLQMAHLFAERQANYLPLMQGFALLYKSLADQSVADRARLQ